MINMKFCNKCRVNKTVDNFSKCKSKKDGLNYCCKTCDSERYFKNAEKNRERQREYSSREDVKQRAKDNKLNRKDKIKFYMLNYFKQYPKKEYDKKYYELNIEKKQNYRINNRDKIRNQSREYYLFNKERISEKHKEWKKSSSGRIAVRNYSHKRRLMYSKLNLYSTITINEWNNLINKYNHCCVYCLQHEKNCGKLTIEHIVPISKGGAHCVDNIFPVCQSCNSKKRDLSLCNFVKRYIIQGSKIR